MKTKLLVLAGLLLALSGSAANPIVRNFFTTNTSTTNLATALSYIGAMPETNGTAVNPTFSGTLTDSSTATHTGVHVFSYPGVSARFVSQTLDAGVKVESGNGLLTALQITSPGTNASASGVITNNGPWAMTYGMAGYPGNPPGLTYSGPYGNAKYTSYNELSGNPPNSTNDLAGALMYFSLYGTNDGSHSTSPDAYRRISLVGNGDIVFENMWKSANTNNFVFNNAGDLIFGGIKRDLAGVNQATVAKQVISGPANSFPLQINNTSVSGDVASWGWGANHTFLLTWLDATNGNGVWNPLTVSTVDSIFHFANGLVTPDLTVTHAPVLTVTNAAPSNPTTPVLWINVVVGGQTYQMPIYK